MRRSHGDFGQVIVTGVEPLPVKMGVNIKSRLRISMSKPILQSLNVTAAVNEYECTAMAKLMQGYFRSSEFLRSFLKQLRYVVRIVTRAIIPCNCLLGHRNSKILYLNPLYIGYHGISAFMVFQHSFYISLLHMFSAIQGRKHGTLHQILTGKYFH